MKSIKAKETNAMEDLGNVVSEITQRYVDIGKNALDSASGKAMQIGHSTDSYVHENPWLTIGVVAGAAAGVGFLAGFMARGQH